MPLEIAANAPTVLIRKEAFERAGLTRAELDDRLRLTPDEFRVEGELVAVGPLYGDDTAGHLMDLLEAAGLMAFDDYLDLGGNLPEWLRLFALGRRE